jgi:hypothetical protein
MTDDQFAQLRPAQVRRTTPPPAPVRAPPTGQAAGRTLGNEFLEKADAPRASAYSTVTMEFDGDDLIVRGDGAEVFRFSAQSGRPVRLRKEDAEATGADPRTATYMNDKRFVGVQDFGPIPEGTYTFPAPAIERFDFGERLKMEAAGVVGVKSVTVHGQPIHSGDWGTGRVALSPRGRLTQGPIGDVTRRSGFYLHGGILTGSSGCIDIGGNFDTVAAFLHGYSKPITVTVRYKNEPPVVSFFQGTSGALAYGRLQAAHGPSLSLGAEFGPTGGRGLVSAGYDLVLQWAGGALSAGARLDVPFTDKEAFVRAGLGGGLDFRIFRTLYGRIAGGYSWDLSGTDPQRGPEVGGGLRLDLDRVQLEAIYNVLRPAADDNQQVRQTLVRLGFRF